MAFFQSRKNIRLVVLVAVILFFLWLVAVVVSPFIMLAYEGVFLKAELDNPHIDSEYDGWRWVKINNWGECLFPAQWKITEKENIIEITDADGAVIAIGTVLTSEGTAFGADARCCADRCRRSDGGHG